MLRTEAMTRPKMSSGCDMKSVIRSSMLRGSSTKVGKVTLFKLMPTLTAANVANQCVAAASQKQCAPELRDNRRDDRAFILVSVGIRADGVSEAQDAQRHGRDAMAR